MIWVYHLRPKICKNKINENYAYLLIFNIKQIKIVKIYNFLNLNCPDAVSLKNRKEIKIAEICNFLNSNCPDGFDSKVLKIQIFLGANCPDACNSKNIKNSQNKLYQLFKNKFLWQAVSILSNYKPTNIINTNVISSLNLKY